MGGASTTGAVYSVSVLLLPSQATVARTNYDAFHRGWKARSLSAFLKPGDYKVCFNQLPAPANNPPMLDSVELVEQPEDVRGEVALSAVDFRWPGRTNLMYQVQYRNELDDSAWTDLGAPVRGNGTNSVTDYILDRGRRFYRVVRVQ